MDIVDGEIRLTFTGEDPGIAIDLRGRQLPNGPYDVTFKLKSSVGSIGEFFYTTNAKTTLPKGNRLSFEVNASEEWQVVRIEIVDSNRIQQMRIDVSDGPGRVSITELELRDKASQTMISWPETKSTP